MVSVDALANYLPAAFLMVVSTMFNSSDIVVTIFAPYSALAKGNPPACRSIMGNILGKIPLIGLLRGIILHH